jgi:hypothetical protein
MLRAIDMHGRRRRKNDLEERLANLERDRKKC